MMRQNCLNPLPGTGNVPLIHEIHGEPYKVVKAVYMALPWLWSKLGVLTGSLVNSLSMPATLTTTEPTQLLPYPPYVNMQNIKSSVLWAVTNDGTRRYKYRNCYLGESGLIINIDLQAPENQRGIRVLWTIMLANKPWGCRQHGPEFFNNPWGGDDVVLPFNYRPTPPPPINMPYPPPPVGQYPPPPDNFFDDYPPVPPFMDHP